MNDAMYNQNTPNTPILAQRQYNGRNAEPVTANMAHVLVTSRGEHRVVWPHDRAHTEVWQHTRASGVLRGRVRTVYDVDLGIRHLRFDSELPGKGDTFTFRAEAVVEWRVLDPSLVVRSQLRDVRELIQPVVVEAMRRIARYYPIDGSAEAEQAINQQLAGEALDFNDPAQLRDAIAHAASAGHVGREYGLWTRTIANVHPDRTRQSQNDEVRDLEHQIKAERLKQELRLLQEQNRQEVMVGRMGFYRDAFVSGDIDRAVLQVAQNPDELTAVAQVVREQELMGQRMTVDFVNKLIESGAIERWQVNDQAKAALDWLRQSTNAVFHPPAAELDAGGGDRYANGGSRRRQRKTAIDGADGFTGDGPAAASDAADAAVPSPAGD